MVILNYNTNSVDRTQHNNNIKAASTNATGKDYAVVASTLIAYIGDGYKTVLGGSTLSLDYPLLWGTGNVDASATFTNAYEVYPSQSLRNNYANWSGTAYQMCYLVGTVAGREFTCDSNPFTSTVPTSADGKFYIPIGILYSAYQIAFRTSDKMYAFANGTFQRVDSAAHVSTSMTASGSGESVTTLGASSAPLRSLTVHGKSVQNGTPTPSSPVAIESVATPSVWVHGKNLLDNGEREYSGTFTNSYYVQLSATAGSSYKLGRFELQEGVTYTLSMDVTSSVEPFQVSIGAGNGNYDRDVASVSGLTSGRVEKTFTPTATNLALGNILAVRPVRYSTTQTYTFSVSNIQLEIGSTATAYEPYQGTTTPIDLQGNELRSLPDGTEDTLSVDAEGNVTLVKRVGSVDLGTMSWSYKTQGYFDGYLASVSAEIKRPASAAETVGALCTNYVEETTDHVYNVNYNNVFGIRYTNGDIWVRDSSAGTDAAAFKTAMSGVEVVYPLATPQTISLPSITMPEVWDGATVEVVGGVTPTIDAGWLPPMGYAQATADAAQSAAQVAQGSADNAQATANSAQTAADNAQATANETAAHFWADAGGAHVGTVENSAHTSGAGYNMTLGATGSAVGILLDHDDETLASLTQSALNFYADGQMAASYTKDGVGLYSQDENDVAQQVAAFTSSGVTFFDGEGNAEGNIVASFGKDGAIIGAAGGKRVSITDENLAFVDGDEVVASVDGNALVIANASVSEMLSLGSFAWIPRSNGNLALKWMG